MVFSSKGEIMMMKYSFEPVIDSECIAIILGTMPGEESLRQKKYYANPNNLFWKLIYSQYGAPIDSQYKDRCKFLLKNRIAIWDVLEAANRQGSLDANINSEMPNDFHAFLKEYPKIKYIFFNGRTAEKLFKKYYKDIYQTMYCHTLPSSSVTPGRYVMSSEEKIVEWRIVREKLSEAN